MTEQQLAANTTKLEQERVEFEAQKIQFEKNRTATLADIEFQRKNAKTGKGPQKQLKRPDHKVFGKYIACVVYPQKNAQQNTSIFVKVNSYVAEITPGQEVELPEDIIEFLKQATTEVGFFDEEAVSMNGNEIASNGKKGAYSTKADRKYIVEFATEEP